MKTKIFALLLVVLSSNAIAVERGDKINRLMEALGYLEMWSQQAEMGKQKNMQMGQKMIDQVVSQLNPSEEFEKRFTTAFNKFMTKATSFQTPEEMVDVWAKYYSPNFTDSELDQLISFYTSPLGQKDAKVNKETLVSFTNHFQEIGKPIMEKAITEYINDLKIVSRECHCAK